MLVINADDFGLNEQTNDAIMRCFEKGFCSSTSLMLNMPGFEHACKIIHENKLNNYVGIHLNISQGYPLTEGIISCSRFCNKDGEFCLRRGNPIFFLKRCEKDAIAKEIKAQIKRFNDQGMLATHIDSHYHVHTEWAIANVLMPIVRENRIPFMRISRNYGRGMGRPKRIYKGILNKKINRAGLQATRFFGTLDDVLGIPTIVDKNIIDSCEIMIHPHFIDNNLYVDYSKDIDGFMEVARNCFPVEKAVSFSGLHYL